jgi:hypothetical protein
MPPATSSTTNLSESTNSVDLGKLREALLELIESIETLGCPKVVARTVSDTANIVEQIISGNVWWAQNRTSAGAKN